MLIQNNPPLEKNNESQSSFSEIARAIEKKSSIAEQDVELRKEDEEGEEEGRGIDGEPKDASYAMKMRSQNTIEGTLRHLALNPALNLAILITMPVQNPQFFDQFTNIFIG